MTKVNHLVSRRVYYNQMMTLTKLLACVLLFGAEAFATPVPGPASWEDVATSNHCGRAALDPGLESSELPGPFGKDPRAHSTRSADDGYDLQYLMDMSYEDMVAFLVTDDTSHSDIDGLWNYGDNTVAFYSDMDRVLAIMDGIEGSGQAYTEEDDAGIPMLVEFIRAGMYHAFYNTEEMTEYLLDDAFQDNVLPSMLSIAENPAFGFGTDTQFRVVQAFGAYMSIGHANAEVVNHTADLFDQFANNFDEWAAEYDTSNALWWVGEGIRYTLYQQEYYLPEVSESIYFGQIDAVLIEIADLSLMWDLEEDPDFDLEWLFHNFTWWVGYFGMFADPSQAGSFDPVVSLTAIINAYGEWTIPTVAAYYMLDWVYDGVDENGDVFDIEEIYDQLRDWLLPDSYAYDDNTYLFSVGSEVDTEKVNTLYWASKEVLSQFFRMSLRDIPLEQGSADDTLTVVVYNSPREYKFNAFLNDLDTQNGGIYIESWGTFFTYERATQESLYSLEELFRHEYTHYLQGRYLVPGLWGQGEIYQDHRLTWFEEGQAEYLAGSNRLLGILPRRSVVGSISNDPIAWMSLDELFSATYSNGFAFYGYGLAFWDFMWHEAPDLMFDLIETVMSGDAAGFDALLAPVSADADINDEYHDHIADLKTQYDDLIDPATSNLYLYDYTNITDGEIQSDVGNQLGLTNTSVASSLSEYHETFTVTGAASDALSGDTAEDYSLLNELLNAQLTELSTTNWLGYQTANGYFTRDESGNYSLSVFVKKDDGANSWGYSNPGCSDPSACNYEGVVTEDDGSCTFPQSSFAGTGCEVLVVPYQYETIQGAINAAVDDDVIAVYSGTYMENLSFAGKNITVLGEDPLTTIIDGGQAGVVVAFTNDETSAAKLANFTIRGGASPKDGYGGSGIKCFGGSSPTLEDLIITDNTAYRGAGIGASNGSAPTLRRLLIFGNTATEGGGGLFASNGANLWIENTTFADNTASNAVYLSNSTAVLVNTIVWGNASNVGIRLWAGSEIQLRHTDYSTLIDSGNNTTLPWDLGGNFSADPLFSAPSQGDFSLQSTSPCVDAGTADLDSDGIEDLTDYAGLAPDMGTFESSDSTLLGDFNGDGVLDILDILLLVTEVLYNAQTLDGDLTGDGSVNILDILFLVELVLS